MLGLAVPVTASYIIAAVMIAPALTQVGITPAAAHMFIFYYAVLSEVSPPTALSPFAAAAITGGNPFRTTMLSWKYVLPAFVVPLVFTLSPTGCGVLLQGSALEVVATSVAAVLGVAALSAGICRLDAASSQHSLERGLLVAAAVLLFLPQPAATLSGAALARDADRSASTLAARLQRSTV